jgi:site-specific DNA-methyltransferase (adenine-specific)
MIVITTVRKPLEGTVAENVLKWGTGGLNVDGCRLFCGTQHMRGAVGSSNNRTTWNASNDDSLQKPFIATDHPGGRWPANVIFQHLGGCQCIGERKVKSEGHWRPAGSSTGITVYNRGWGGKGPDLGNRMFDPDGLETVSAWDCLPSCPVAELDRQSGTTFSMGGFVRGSTGAFGKHGIYGTAVGQAKAPGFGDTGGASRFFKQVKS